LDELTNTTQAHHEQFNRTGIVIDMPVARILVVDDEEVILALTCRILIQHGYEVLRANGSRQALEVVNNNRPIDLIVSDNQMPGLQGTDLISEIKQFSPETACVLMTAGVVKPEQVPEGVTVLWKPFSVQGLISTIQTALARPAS
jgi:CheY-like chemotaxis protein